jgi:site-specific recombinase XerD
MACLRLRVKDVDFADNQIVVQNGKGDKDRVTVRPLNVKAPLQRHLQDVNKLHDRDVEEGYGRASLPYALERKDRHANRAWAWPSIFPAVRRSIDPRRGIARRHHVSQLVRQRAVKGAVRHAGIPKAASCHTFRPAFATHRLEAGDDIRTVQVRLGHQDVTTTMIFPHVLTGGGRGVRSPGDLL